VDATPLGCAAGKLANIPTILLTNFTWDYCFREMLLTEGVQKELMPTTTECKSSIFLEYEEMIMQCNKDSFSCDYYIKLPGQTPNKSSTSSFKTIDGPLIARLATADARIRIRKSLGISDDQKILLLGFGGHDTDWNLENRFLPDGWVCLILGISESALEKLSLPKDRFRSMSFDSYVPDLIAASDVVLGKIGYGFVSECLANGTPLVYVPRSNWPEEPFVGELYIIHSVVMIIM